MKVGRDGIERQVPKIVSDCERRRIEIAPVGRHRSIYAAVVDALIGVVVRRRVVQIHVLAAHVICRQIKCYLGLISGEFEGQSTNRLIRLWQRSSQDWVGEKSV